VEPLRQRNRWYAVPVPRDTARTKERLLDAAVAEFVTHGLAGATMERIARAAGVNKERLYAYFGDKNSLFATVLADKLIGIADAVPLNTDSVAAVAEFAASTYDYQVDNPDLARLIAWEALAGADATSGEHIRAERYGEKCRQLARAQRAGIVTSALPAPHLLALLLSVSNWWATSPQVAKMITGLDDADPSERAARRTAVVEAASRLVQPAAEHQPRAAPLRRPLAADDGIRRPRG